MSAASTHKVSGDIRDLKQEALFLPADARRALFDRLWQTVPIYGLEIRVNDGKPRPFYSRLSVSAALSAGPNGRIDVTLHAAAKQGVRRSVVANIRPGDRLHFRYFSARETDESSLDCSLNGHRNGKAPEAFSSSLKHANIGFDVQMETGAPVRVWHPGGTGVVLSLANPSASCLSVLSIAATAQAEDETWYWDFDEILSGHSVSVKVLETGWFDQPSRRESNKES